MEDKDQHASDFYGADRDSNTPPPGSSVRTPPPGRLAGVSLDMPDAPGLLTSQEQPQKQTNPLFRFTRRLDVVLAILLVVGGAIFFLSAMRGRDDQGDSLSASGRYGTVALPLGELISGKDLTLDGASAVTINGSMQLNNGLLLAPSLQPTGAKPGQIYYDQGTNQLAYFNGEVFVFLTSPDESGVQSLGGASGQLTIGDGIAITGNELNNTGVLTVQGQTGAVTFTAGPGIVINGTNFSNSGVISVSASTPNVTVTNDGAGNVTIGVVGAGTGTVSSPGGTAGTIPLFTAAQTIEDSIITQSGLSVLVSGTLNVSTNIDVGGTFVSGTGNAFQVDLSGNVTSAGGGMFQGGSLAVGSAAQLGSLLLYDGSSNTGTIRTAALGQDTVYTLPDPGGAAATICLSTGNCSGASVTLQGAYDNSTNPEIVVDITRGALTVRDAAIAIGGNLLEVQSNNGATTYFGVTSTGVAVTGTTTSTGNINSSTGGLQTGGNTRVDNSGNLTNIGNLTATAGITIASTGGGNDIILNAADTIELQDNTNITGSADISGTLTAGTANAFQVAVGGDITTAGSAVLQGGVATIGTITQAGTLVLHDGSNHTGTLQVAALGQNTVYTLPDPGGNASICLTTGNCAGVGGGVTTGGGTTNRLAKFSGAQAIADSTISDDGTNVITSVDMVVQGGQLTTGTTAQTGSIILHDGNGQTTTVQAGDSSGNLTFILPTSAGNANQCLKQSGVGDQLVWQDCDGGSGGSSATLQTAYNNGNAITTSDARDIDIVLANTTTDSLFDLVIADDSTGYASFSRADGAGTADPAQIILVDNLDANRPVPIGVKIQAAGGGMTTALDASDVEIDTALSVGANTIAGTTGNIDYSNFDVAGTTGNVTAGTYNGQTVSSAANFTGTVTVANNLTLTSGDIAVNGGDITSSGALNITPGGALVVGDTAQTALLQGSVTTITSTGAGNDIILNAADTIELQDNTNLTGNLDISGTLTSGTLNAFQVAADGSITSASSALLQGGTITLGTTSQAGSVVLSDGSSHTGTLQTVALGQNTVYTLPDPGLGSATICLNTGNCAGVGGTGNILQGGNSFGAAVTLGTNDNFDFNLETRGTTWVTLEGVSLQADLAPRLVLASNVDLILQGATAYMSNPMGQTDSEGFGLNVTMSGLRSVAVGNGATAGGNESVVIGQSATACQSSVAIGYDVAMTCGSGAVGIGHGVNTNGGSVAIGLTAGAGSNGIAIGSGAAASGTSVALGLSASTGARSVGIGDDVTTGTDGVAIGHNASAANNRSIALGRSATTTTSNQLVIGGSTTSTGYITEAYIGSGVTDVTPQNIVLQATGGSGTDIAGANFTIAGGRGTGTGNGGNINFQIADPGTTGSSLNALTTVLSLNGGNGAAILQNSTDSTRGFGVLNAAGDNIFTVSTSNSRIGINLGGSVAPTLGGAGIEMQGGLRLSGGNSSGSFVDQYTTPVGAGIQTKINIPNYNPGSGNTTIATGLTSVADDTSTAIAVFDARTNGNHWPSIAVYSPDESKLLGFSWAGSNTEGRVTTHNATGTTGGIALQSGDTAGASTSSGAVAIRSGNGVGSDNSTGAISIDSGSPTGSGTSGAITIGTTNSNSITIGKLTGSASTTIQGGTGDINLTTNAATASVIVKSTTNNSEAFKVVNGSNASLLTVKTDGTLGTDMGTYVTGTGTNGAGGRLFFGTSNLYIGESSTTDTDFLEYKAEDHSFRSIGSNEIMRIDGDNGKLTLWVQSASNGGFNIFDAGGEQIFFVDPDSTNPAVFIGNDNLDSLSTVLVLDSAGFTMAEQAPSDDRTLDGAMYYSASRGTFRCFDGGNLDGTEANNDFGGQWKECLGVPKPNTRRWAYITHQGGTGTTFDTQGDAAAAAADTTTGQAATTSEPSAVRYATSTSSGNVATMEGNANYNSSNNPTYQAYIAAQSASDIRIWAGLSSQTGANMGASATPGSAEYAAFRYDSAVDGGGDYQCVLGNAAGGTPFVQGSGIGVGTGGHKLEVTLFSGKRAMFKIDGEIVCSISAVTAGTDFPAASTMMRYVNTVTTLTAAAKSIQVAWVYIETDK